MVGVAWQVRCVKVQSNRRTGGNNVRSGRRPDAGGEIRRANRDPLSLSQRLPENIFDGCRNRRGVCRIGIERVRIDRLRQRRLPARARTLRVGAWKRCARRSRKRANRRAQRRGTRRFELRGRRSSAWRSNDKAGDGRRRRTGRYGELEERLGLPLQRLDERPSPRAPRVQRQHAASDAPRPTAAASARFAAAELARCRDLRFQIQSKAVVGSDSA